MIFSLGSSEAKSLKVLNFTEGGWRKGLAPKLNSHCWYDMKLAAAKKPDLAQRGRKHRDKWGKIWRDRTKKEKNEEKRKRDEVKGSKKERRWQTLCELTWQMRTPVSLAVADVRSDKRSFAFCWDPTGSRWHLLNGTHTQQNEALACYYCYLCGMWARAWMLAVTAWVLKITKQSRQNNKTISKHWHSKHVIITQIS